MSSTTLSKKRCDVGAAARLGRGLVAGERSVSREHRFHLGDGGQHPLPLVQFSMFSARSRNSVSGVRRSCEIAASMRVRFSIRLRSRACIALNACAA